MIDQNVLFTLCTKPRVNPSIRARLVYDYVVDPFKVWCEFHAPHEEKDHKDTYLDFLMEQGNEHEKKTIGKKYPLAEMHTFKTLEKGFESVIASMIKGTDTIGNAPLLFRPERLSGIVDVLEKNTSSPSIFGDYHYTVNEIKLAKNIKGHHIKQGAFYNYLIGIIQGYTPEIFYLINREGKKTTHIYNESELFAILGDIRDIYNGKNIAPTYGACDWPWETYANQRAIENKDLSLVGGVRKSTKYKLLHGNISTLDELACSTIPNLTKIKGIGEKSASKFRTRAQAIVQEKPIKLKNAVFDNVSTEIFLDLEGTGEQQTEHELVAMDYLIGVTTRHEGKTEYISFLAKDLNSEKEMFIEFLDWLKTQEDYIIYHWHHYEKTHLKKISQRHEIIDSLDELLFSKLVDLYKIANECFAFPTYGTGLKEIAKYVGFDWRDEDISAMTSAVIYFRYVQTGNDEGLDRVIGYNEDDCNATMVINDWIVKNQ